MQPTLISNVHLTLDSPFDPVYKVASRLMDNLVFNSKFIFPLAKEKLQKRFDNDCLVWIKKPFSVSLGILGLLRMAKGNTSKINIL